MADDHKRLPEPSNPGSVSASLPLLPSDAVTRAVAALRTASENHRQATGTDILQMIRDWHALNPDDWNIHQHFGDIGLWVRNTLLSSGASRALTSDYFAFAVHEDDIWAPIAEIAAGIRPFPTPNPA